MNGSNLFGDFTTVIEDPLNRYWSLTHTNTYMEHFVQVFSRQKVEEKHKSVGASRNCSPEGPENTRRRSHQHWSAGEYDLPFINIDPKLPDATWRLSISGTRSRYSRFVISRNFHMTLIVGKSQIFILFFPTSVFPD